MNETTVGASWEETVEQPSHSKLSEILNWVQSKLAKEQTWMGDLFVPGRRRTLTSGGISRDFPGLDTGIVIYLNKGKR